ncbi:activating transcription factor 7-interacting protein 1-like [Stylophora pistillata]|uniref:Activating transcription factor 7-interacting protein 1 n=1 Tax=Stylophora pistillata TaxID=50429 RepID=A0A2B4RNG6_STYPI|nr:activating transcription factor 7-interacting protein 1-like [Stylophora pistillata]XP_022802992.1 activating transcription factor 7-interacting protein 1-like [Stylophora pistillata]PFX17782.1 Activating transcription factor 7-interacting protein 1 [Stylophora pistillata]
MEELEIPNKKRKFDGGSAASTPNHVVTNGESIGTSDAASTRPPSHLKFNLSRFERLRQITIDCQKHTRPQPKPNGSKIIRCKGPVKEPNPEINSSNDANSPSPDLIISSAGSSPAHSPKPTDFKMLSTPPGSNKLRDTNPSTLDNTSELNSSDRQKACIKLLDKFDESSSQTLSNGVSAEARTLEQDSLVEVLDEGDQTRPMNPGAKAVPVNGEISLLGENKVSADNDKTSAKDQSSPSLSDLAPSSSAEETTRDFNFNSDEFRQMVKKMIQERMSQIQQSMDDDSPNDKLTVRLAALEKENKALKEYAKRVEDSVKTILKAESLKAKKRETKAVQTQDFNWSNALRTKTVNVPSPPASLTATRPSNASVNIMTTPTPRLTSTVAPLPGHTVPQSAPVNYRPAVQRQSEPVRPRIPVVSNVSPRPQAPIASGANYVPNYDLGPALRPTPTQLAVPRGAAPTVRQFPSGHSGFNGLRAPPPPSVQHPRPMMRIQRPITSLPGPRSVAPAPSRPLPTVTVHPQTPSSSTSVRGPPELPSYGYNTQNAYHNGKHSPRFAVTPQMRPQAPQPPQGGLPQVTQVPRPAYPQSPIQASQSQHMLQQSHRQEQQQHPQRHLPPVLVRQNAPVQMQSPPHAVSQQASPHPQQPGMVRYQQVVGPPRQVAPPQPSVPQPSYAQVPIRSPQPAQQGLPPGSGQHPPVSPAAEAKDVPPKPSVSIAVASSGIVLSWYMALEERHAPIKNYQLFALQDGGPTENPHQWKKIGVVKALPLPMACTLTQFSPGNKYHFLVRATDEYGRQGECSEACTITLK